MKSTRERSRPLRFLSPLHRASRQLSLNLQELMDGLELSPHEGHVLAYLCRFAPCPVGELVRVFGYNKSTLTGVLDRLERAGCLHRELNPEDRRSFLVTVTPEGKRKGAALRQITEALERRIASRITPADLRGFDRVMSAIADVTGVQVRPDPSAPLKARKS
jgi:DNA-binding MarR family transcriptional regulator